MHKSATKCNEIVGKWCKNKHGASKIMDTLETYQCYGWLRIYVAADYSQQHVVFLGRLDRGGGDRRPASIPAVLGLGKLRAAGMVHNIRVEGQPPREQSSMPLFGGSALLGSSTASAGRSSTVTKANEALLLPGPSDAGEVDLTPHQVTSASHHICLILLTVCYLI
jgi:hypothetical protein